MTSEELQEIATTEKEARAEHPHHICVCTAAGCLSAGSGEVKKALEKEVLESGMKHECHVKGVGCMGLCSAGPLITVDETMYRDVKPEDAHRHRAQPRRRQAGEAAARATPRRRSSRARARSCSRTRAASIPSASRTTSPPAATRRCSSVVTEKRPGDVLEQVIKSGLRGRGGAGYPTGLKWSTVAKAAAPGRNT